MMPFNMRLALFAGAAAAAGFAGPATARAEEPPVIEWKTTTPEENPPAEPAIIRSRPAREPGKPLVYEPSPTDRFFAQMDANAQRHEAIRKSLLALGSNRAPDFPYKLIPYALIIFSAVVGGIRKK